MLQLASAKGWLHKCPLAFDWKGCTYDQERSEPVAHLQASAWDHLGEENILSSRKLNEPLTPAVEGAGQGLILSFYFGIIVNIAHCILNRSCTIKGPFTPSSAFQRVSDYMLAMRGKRIALA